MSIQKTGTLERLRRRHLAEFANYTMQTISRGQLTSKGVKVEACHTIAGPRSGAVELLMGLEAAKVQKALAAGNCAMLRRLIPWEFTGEPQAYMHGRYLRLEAGWPDGLAETMVRLSDLSTKPTRKPGAWVAGKSEAGATIVPSLSDKTPHYLLAGESGAGKSVAVQNAVIQLSEDPDNQIILIDGKFGESLRALERLPGVVGPCAVEPEDARAAMAWAVAKMRDRYTRGLNGDGWLVITVDEIQELVADAAIVDMMRRCASQGRAAKLAMLVTTQHPTVEAFGHPAIRRALVGKVALRVDDPDASRVAVGGASPRADHLLGAGDSFIVGPGACHRVQGAFVDQTDVDKALERANGRARWQVERWPDFCAEDLGQDLPTDGRAARSQFEVSGAEFAVALAAAIEDAGRPTLKAMLEQAGLGRPGSSRAARMMAVGREAYIWLHTNGYVLGVTA